MRQDTAPHAPICRVLSAVGDAIRWREYLMRSSDT